VCITFLMAELGLSFYFYLFFAGEQNPPMNWAYPRTWEGFIHAVSRGQYERINPADMFSLKFVRQVGGYLTDLRNQYTLPVLLVGLLPFTAWRISWRGRRLSAYPLALGLALLSALLVIPEAMLMRAGSAAAALGAVVLAYRGLMLAIAILAGIGVLVALVGYLEAVCRPPPGADAWTRMAGWLVAAALGLGLLYVDAMVLSHVFRGGLSFGAALALCLLVIVPPAAGWAVWLLRREPHGLDLEMSPSQQTWLLATLAGFFSLTVIFVLFLNISLDIQTVFITRVQFIQSHGLYALWLGYGLLLTLTFVELLARGRRAARYAAVALALAVPGVLLHMNAYDEAQLRIIGGAEQNGHDFGWQFGAWELEGVDAILREIGPEERAGYPNPAYPRPMERNAIFFGGTDPGRFVPTYMIYSAKVRPDVFLITQNALADNMYMNVMRDLYGDAIWIPSQFDSNRAFQQYVADVQAGRISAGADVSLKDGRVSVQGVQGVMQINGILCRMIFDHNKARHAFYVEESYVIPWMYPYLEPHGLILKLNTEPVALSPETVRNDRAFWDWYTKRLLGNPKFVRDIVARKTFSKLRSAIAGIYAFRREWAEAEYAFEQSITLYPLSPEANFRLADVYLQQGKFAEAARLMEAFGREDPNNDKIGEFLAHVRGLEQTSKRKAELEAVLATGRMEVAQAVELMDVYRKMQAWAGFERLMAGLLQDANVPVEAYLRIAQMCAESRRLDLVEVALAHAVQREPGNLGVWTDLAAVQLAMQKPDAALQTVRIAVERGGEPLRDRLRGDPRFNGIRTHPEFQRLVPAAAPMGPLQLPGSLQPFLR
jgi:thioredoxin-like negative regulator of GroEL